MPRATSKLFRYGSSQAVRLSKEFRMSGDEVYIEKRGDTLVLSPKDRPWDRGAALHYAEIRGALEAKGNSIAIWTCSSLPTPVAAIVRW